MGWRGLPDLSLHVGDGLRRMRYIDWLMTERERITQSEERQVDIVDEAMVVWRFGWVEAQTRHQHVR